MTIVVTKSRCARLAKGFPPVATPFEKVGSLSSKTNTTDAAFLRGVPLREVRAKRNQTQNTATLLSAEQRQVKERNGINGGDPP